MDVLYEESAVSANAPKVEKRYKVINIISKFFGALAVIFAVIFLFNLLTFLFSFKAMKAEDRGSAIALLIFLLFTLFLIGADALKRRSVGVAEF